MIKPNENLYRWRSLFLACQIFFFSPGMFGALHAANLDSDALASESTVGSVDVDTEIVLAINASWSVDLNELWLQRNGFSDALKSADVEDAIHSGPFGRIAVTYFEWAGPGSHREIIPWIEATDADDLEAAIESLDDAPLSSGQGASLSAAILNSLSLLESNRYHGQRKVIALVGAVENKDDPDLEKARNAALQKGVEIVAMPLMIRSPWAGTNLDAYYEENVIVGKNSFLVPVTDAFELEAAAKELLTSSIREVQ